MRTQHLISSRPDLYTVPGIPQKSEGAITIWQMNTNLYKP
jgi:hypothetical protein